MLQVEADKIRRRYRFFTDEELAELWQAALDHNDFDRLWDIALVRRLREEA